MWKITDWANPKTVEKYSPGIRATLQSLKYEDWLAVDSAFNLVSDMMNAERVRRSDV